MRIPDDKGTAVIKKYSGHIDAITERSLKIGKEVGKIASEEFPLTPILDPPTTSAVIGMHDSGIQAGKPILLKIRKPKLTIQAFIV